MKPHDEAFRAFLPLLAFWELMLASWNLFTALEKAMLIRGEILPQQGIH